MQNNIIEIPRDPTYDLPEGTFKARLLSVTPKSRFHQDKQIAQIRFIFEVDIPGIDHLQHLAGRTFDSALGKKDELRFFVERWKGFGWLQLQSSRRIDFGSFVGEEVELELTHLQRPPHNKPFVLISDIRSLRSPSVRQDEIKLAA